MGERVGYLTLLTKRRVVALRREFLGLARDGVAAILLEVKIVVGGERRDNLWIVLQHWVAVICGVNNLVSSPVAHFRLPARHKDVSLCVQFGQLLLGLD